MCIEELKVVVLIVNAGIYFVRGLNCASPSSACQLWFCILAPLLSPGLGAVFPSAIWGWGLTEGSRLVEQTGMEHWTAVIQQRDMPRVVLLCIIKVLVTEVSSKLGHLPLLTLVF